MCPLAGGTVRADRGGGVGIRTNLGWRGRETIPPACPDGGWLEVGPCPESRRDHGEGSRWSEWE